MQRICTREPPSANRKTQTSEASNRALPIRLVEADSSSRHAPTSIAFEDTFVGYSSLVSLVIGNVGTDVLNVTGYSIDNAAFSLDVATPLPPFAVPYGTEALLQVRYAPASASAVSGTLTLYTDDPNHLEVGVSLTGLGVDPPIASIIPGSLGSSPPEQ